MKLQTLLLDINGTNQRVTTLRAMNGLWVHLNGETQFVPHSKSGKARGAGGSVANPEQIEAPMPGKIVKILCASGASIQTGDSVAVMEAMKMEYTLKAAMTGKVVEVKCKEGEQVALGQILFRLGQA